MKKSVAVLAAVFAEYPQVQVDIDPDGRIRIVGCRDGMIDEIRETGTPMTDKQRAYLFALARQFGFTDEERHDLAEVVLRRDIESWKDLTQHEAGRLIDSFEGFGKVSHILLTNRRGSSGDNGEPG